MSSPHKTQPVPQRQDASAGVENGLSTSLTFSYSCACCVLSPFSRVQLFATPLDCSPPGSSVHGFSRQEYWSGLPCPPAGDLPDPGIKSESITSHASEGGFFTLASPRTMQISQHCVSHVNKYLERKGELSPLLQDCIYNPVKLVAKIC